MSSTISSMASAINPQRGGRPGVPLRPSPGGVRPQVGKTRGKPPHGRPGASKRKNSRPPFVPVAVLAAFLCFSGLALVLSDRDASIVHSFAAFFGMFGSVLVFGWFRLIINSRSSSGNFSDWGVVSSSTTVRSLLIFAWVLGTSNLFLVVYEWARRFAEGGA